MVTVVMLSTAEARKGFIYAESKSQWKKMGFKVVDFTGIRTPGRTSQIVMRNWQRFFELNKAGNSYANNIKGDIIIAEDDVEWRLTQEETMAKINKNKINWLCHQKTFKDKIKGETKTIEVGSQAIFIPAKLKDAFSKKIMSHTGMHFDRWISLYVDYVNPFKAKEHCAEFTSKSTTLKAKDGKPAIRKGKDIKVKVKFEEREGGKRAGKRLPKARKTGEVSISGKAPIALSKKDVQPKGYLFKKTGK